MTVVDIDGWHVRHVISPLFFNDNTDLHNLIRKRLILPYLVGSFHNLLLKNMQADFLWLCRNRMEAFAPFSRRDLASLLRQSRS
jgi:hypothetical protein